MLPDDFPGDRPAGAETFVKAVRAALRVRFRGGQAPSVLFTDRGAGFFNPGNGVITLQYRTALAASGLRAFQGNVAAVQPGKLSDLMLHETAVAWIRKKERTTLPARPWEETPAQLGTRLKRIASEINAEHDVSGLCNELPARVEQLRLHHGCKLKK